MKAIRSDLERRLTPWAIGLVVAVFVAATARADGLQTPAIPAAFDNLPSFPWLILKTVITLTAVLATFLVTAKWILPRLRPRTATGGPRLIEVLETHRLEARSTLYAVRFGDRCYLVASGNHGVQTIGQRLLIHVGGQPLTSDGAHAVRAGVWPDFHELMTRRPAPSASPEA